MNNRAPFAFHTERRLVALTGLKAKNLPELLRCLHEVAASSDFSQWLRVWGEDKLAKALDKLDPYIMTRDELKKEIIRLGKNNGKII